MMSPTNRMQVAESQLAARDVNNWVVMPKSLIDDTLLSYHSVEIRSWRLATCSDGCFHGDQFVGEVDQWGVLFEGVLLNKAELLESFEVASIESLLREMLNKLGVEGTLRELRGPFSGVFIDLELDIPYVFGNQTGDTAAYVGFPEIGPLLSNSFDLIMSLAKAQGWKSQISDRAAQMMVQYAFMLDGTTFAEDVQRVLPGTFNALLSGGPKFGEIVRYWSLPEPHTFEGSFDDAVEALEVSFSHAVERCFSKDLEYGFRDHLVDVSAGLDSRMVNLVAEKLGHSHITNITYSESGSSEEHLAIRWAVEQGNSCLFYPLDGGTCLLDPEATLQLNGGAGFYAGITGGKPILERLNLARFGLEHTGQLGDVVFGTFSTDVAIDYSGGAYSREQVFQGELLEGVWQNQEQFLMYTRGFLGVLSTHLLRRHFTYAVSPFIDVDVLDLAFSVPTEWRSNHKLYTAWLRRYHREAFRVPSTRRLRDERNAIGHLAHEAAHNIRRGVLWAERKIPRKYWVLNNHDRNTMNPAEQWYQSNPELRSLISEYADRASRVPFSPQTIKSLKWAFGAESSIWEKLQAVTVVGMHDRDCCTFR